MEDTRALYDSDKESSPFARARVSGSTPGTPLYLPSSGSFVPPIPGDSPIRGGLYPSGERSGSGSPRLQGLGPRDLLASVSSSYASR